MTTIIDQAHYAAQTSTPHAPLRSWRERVLQTLLFEAGGLMLVAPLYAIMFGAEAGETFTLLITLSILVMIWSPLHNTAFDVVEGNLTGRVASDRPQRIRLLHALSHELSTIAVTLPAVILIGDHDFWTGLTIDVGLSLSYAAYAYIFHMIFDHARPVTKGE